MFLQFPGNVTNRLDAGGNPENIIISGAPAAAGVSAAAPVLSSPTALLISPVQYTVPNPSTQTVTITISGIRVAVPTAGSNGGSGVSFLNASVAAPTFGITSGLPVPVAQAAPSLLSSVLNYGVPCLGSPSPGSSLPSPITFPGLTGAGTAVSTIRITEASASAFASEGQSPTGDFGVRFLVSLSGYGPNAQVYVPDAIVGNRGTTPTSAGAYNSSQGGGTYTSGLNQLLLSRVNGADATGVGGSLALGAPSGVTSFTSVNQVTLVNGAGTVTYEVIDDNPGAIDSAQIPVFVVSPATNCSTVQVNTLGATLAPASAVSVATQADPIPRYIATTPASDCTFFGDCAATYFPVLQAAPASITLNGSSLGQTQTAFITATNGGQSQLSFTATTTYQTASNQSTANWLSINGAAGTVIQGIVDPSAGINGFVLNLSASPAALQIPGTYQATVTINAGSAGTVAVPVTFNVGVAGPVIQGVVNAANSQPGPITAGSFAAIYGLNLVPKTSAPATVAVNGIPATVTYDGQPSPTAPTQINILIPAGLTSPTVAVTATIDGTASNNFPVSLVTNAPAVFNPGILNQNNSVNSTSVPASLNDVIQIFLTGLATPVTLPVTVNIGSSLSLTGSQIIYAGAVASVPGLDQINVQVPASLTFTGNSAPLSICVPGANGQPTCSAPVPLYLH
ncbi:MAG TPA: hypothetical protein VHY84_09820 [Bryobacteraceae bacterium]|nr:hypothetical protein [Bryobacteraceae bacterium]